MLTDFFYVREEMLERVWPTMFAGAGNGQTMYGKPPHRLWQMPVSARQNMSTSALPTIQRNFR
jgi:hypothetical protein